MNYNEFSRLPIATATAPENRQMLARYIASKGWPTRIVAKARRTH